MRQQKFHYIVLFSIFLVALLLRLWRINMPYVELYSWREASTAMMAENFFTSNPNIFFPQISWNGPGPSYNGREFQTVTYIASLLYRIFGIHNNIGRLVAVCFGMWGLFALYKLTKLVWDQKHAVITIAMMALLPQSIFGDRSFLPDPAMVALVTTCLWLFVIYLQTEKLKYLYLSAIIGCLGFLTKLPGAIAGLPMLYAFIVYYSRKTQPGKLTLSQLIIPGILATVIISAYYFWAYHLATSYPPYHFAGEKNWVWNEPIINWIKEGFFLKRFIWILLNLSLGPAFLLLTLIGSLSSYFNRNMKHQSFALPQFFNWWLAGFIFYYFIGAKELIDNPHNLQVFTPIVAALSARGVLYITSLIRNQKFEIVVYGILLALMLFSNRPVIKQLYDTDEAFVGYKLGLALKKTKTKNDLVLVMGENLGSPVAIYYSGSKGWVFPCMELNGVKMNIYSLPTNDSVSIEMLESLISKNARWFGIVQFQYDIIKNKHPVFFNYLQNTYNVAEQTHEYIIFNLSKKITAKM
ncbi:MAG: glycosyltransferase family 39 protein [Bacteroidota bacterium]